MNLITSIIACALLAMPVISTSAPVLLPYQQAWVDDSARFKIWLASRQIGKSYAAAYEAITDCLYNPGSTWLILSAGQRQAREFALKAQDLARLLDDEETLKTTRDSLAWANGSRILALPANPSTARGYSAHLILDEFAFHKDSTAIWRSLYPTISNPLNGTLKLRIISTPNGRNNKFLDLWNSQATARYSKHEVSIHQAIANGLCRDSDPAQFLTELKEGISDLHGWAQEYECQFSDGSDVLISYEDILHAESADASSNNTTFLTAKSGPIFCGIDFGRVVDPTVCWTLEKIGDVFWTREILVLERMNTVDQYAILQPRIERSARTALDATGPGLGFADLVESKLTDKVDPCQFNGPFQLQLFPRLQRHFQPPYLVRIPACPKVREDLQGITVTFINGQCHYSVRRSKSGHSDRAIALALALHAAQEFSREKSPGQFIATPHNPLSSILLTRRSRSITG